MDLTVVVEGKSDTSVREFRGQKLGRKKVCQLYSLQGEATQAKLSGWQSKSLACLYDAVFSQ